MELPTTFKQADPQVLHCDVLVIGGGLAGAFAAIKARDAGAQNVIMMDKGWPGKSGCSALAAGVFTNAPDLDDFDNWFQRCMVEICENGDYLNDQPWLEIVLREFQSRLEDMDAWGCPFIKTPDGKFARILVRGSNPSRAIRAVKFAGSALMEKVRTQLNRSKVKLLPKVMATDFITDELGHVVGACGVSTIEGTFHAVYAPAVVVAAGGTYGRGTYFGHKPQSGDSYGMEWRIGVKLMNFDVISRNQAAIAFDLAGMATFQGLGARFLNRFDEEFMPLYDPELGNRALKKTQAYSMAMEVRQGRGPIYLDMTHFSDEEVRSMWENLPFPMTILERAGILQGDRITRKIEWGPGGPGTIAQGGGAWVDLTGATSVPGLFAAGDAAAKMSAGTGETGAGALIWASVSGGVSGRHAAAYAAGRGPVAEQPERLAELAARAFAPALRQGGIDPNHVIVSTQEIICPWDSLIVKNESRMIAGLGMLDRLLREEVPQLRARDPHELRLAHEAESLLLTSKLMMASSLARKESRSELREDYPDMDNVDWLKWIFARNQEGEALVWTEDIPIDEYPVKPERKKFRHPAWAAAERSGLPVPAGA